MWVAKAQGNGWDTHDSAIHGPYTTKQEAIDDIEKLYPEHLYLWILELAKPGSKRSKGIWESVRHIHN